MNPNSKYSTFNKVLSLLLVFCMIFSMIPNIFAADETTYTYYIITEVEIDEKVPEYFMPYFSISIYGTNYQNATSGGNYLTSTSKNKMEQQTPYSWKGTITTTETTKYEYIYPSNYYSHDYYYNSDGFLTIDQSVEKLTEGEEYNAAITELGTSENVIVFKIKERYETVNHQYQITIDKYWDDNNNEKGTRPEQLELQIWGSPQENYKDPAKLIDTLTISSDNIDPNNPNHWQITTDLIETIYSYIFIEPKYSEDTTGYIFSSKEELIAIEGQENQYTYELTSSINKQLNLDLEISWYDNSSTETRYPVTLNIYGANTKEDADNQVNGTFLTSTQLTSNYVDEYSSSLWGLSYNAFINEEYPYYYAEAIINYPNGQEETYEIVDFYNYSNNEENSKTFDIRFYIYKKAKHTLNIKHTWDDENNIAGKRPESITFNLVDNKYKPNRIIEKQITLSNENDLNLDNDPNTWEYQIELDSYVYVSNYYATYDTEDTAQSKYVFSTSTSKNGTAYNINISSSFVKYIHEITINHTFDENILDEERPTQITYDLYGWTSNYTSSYYKGPFLETVILDSSNQSETNSKLWTKTITIESSFEYIGIGNKNFNNNFKNTAYLSEGTLTNNIYYHTLTSSTSKNFNESFIFKTSYEDYSNAYNLRPPIPTYKVYGSLEENATSGGDFLFEYTPEDTYDSDIPKVFDKDYKSYYFDLIFEDVETPYGTYKWVETEIKQSTDTPPDEYLHATIGLVRTIPITIRQIWDDAKSPANTRPENVDFLIYDGTSEYWATIKETVTLTAEDVSPDNPNIWEKTINITTYFTDFSIKQFTFDKKDYYTDPQYVEIVNNTEDDIMVAEIINEISNSYIEQPKNVEFNIVKTWDDQNNKYNDRPESFIVELYGTFYENDTENGTLINTYEFKATDDLKKDLDDNTWEFNIKGIETNFNYFYVKEIINNDEILGSYALTANNIIKDSIQTIPQKLETIKIPNIQTNSSLFNLNISPMSSWTQFLNIKKVWFDNNDTAGMRPESIKVKIYANTANNFERAYLAATLEIREDGYDVLYSLPDHNWENYSYGSISEPWTASAWIDCGDYTYWILEENVELENEEYYKMEISRKTIDYNPVNVITNTYIDHPVYNINLTNTYTPEEIPIDFNIIKTWNDNNNELGERPESITLKLYGTENENTTSDGELLKEQTFTISDDLTLDTDDNTWELKFDTIKTHYEYFYVEEIINGTFANGSYFLTNSTIAKKETTPEQEASTANIPEMPEIMPLSGGTNDIYLTKIWDDSNPLEKDYRPEYIILKITEKELYLEEEPVLTTIMKLYPDKVEFIKNDSENIYWNPTTVGSDSNNNNWSITGETNYFTTLTIEEELPKNSKYYTMSHTEEHVGLPFSDTHQFDNITNTFTPLTYNIELTNTYEKYEPVYFNITKTWDDKDNEKGERPESITLKIYGTNTEGDITNGELLKEQTFNISEDLTLDSDNNTWEFQIRDIMTNYDYFYVEEIVNGTFKKGTYSLSSSSINLNTQNTISLASDELDDPYGISPMAAMDVDVDITKIWVDNDNANNTRPEYIVINAYYDNEFLAKYYLYENKIELIEENGPDNLSGYNPLEGLVSTGSWSAGASIDEPDAKYLSFEEEPILTKNGYYKCEANISSYKGVNATFTNTFIEVKTYNIELTNTYEPNPEPVIFNIIKTWDDQNNKYNERPTEITLKIYGVETEGATTGGELIKTQTLKASDDLNKDNNTNTWEFQITDILTTYKYFYAEEIINGTFVRGTYSLTANNVALNTNNTISITSQSEKSDIMPLGAAPETEFEIYKVWEDNDNALGLRPEYITLNIYTEDLELVDILRIYENKVEVLQNNSEDFSWGSGETTTPWSAYGAQEPWITSSAYTFEEIIGNNYYTSEITISDYFPGIGDTAIVTITNTIKEIPEYNIQLTNTYELNTRDVQFKVNKTWIGDTVTDRPVNVVFDIYGTEIEGATENGTRIGSITLNANDLVTNTTDKWERISPVIQTTYEYFYVIESGANANYTAVINPLEKSTQGTTELITINATNTIKDIKLTITKIWDDEDNFYNTRPSSITIKLYQNGTFFKDITVSEENKVTGNNNKWQVVDISVPKYDVNGVEYNYTIQEDFNLSLQMFYKTPTYNQEELTVTNYKKWISVEVVEEIEEPFTITIGKEILSGDGDALTANDYNKMNLNDSYNYQFPITLKELNRDISNNNGLTESYNGYTGNVYQGLVDITGNLVFYDIYPGKYELSENFKEYFYMDIVEEISSTEGAELTCENGKYYITLSGITGNPESISIVIKNKLEEFRPFIDNDEQENYFLIHRRK